MNAASHLLLALACAAGCVSVQAERSRLSEDADVLDAGDCEVEVGLQRQTTRGSAAERESALRLNCGAGAASELSLAVARQRSGADRGRAAALEAKSVLRKRDDGVGVALLWGLGAEREGSGPWRRHEQFAAIEATWEPAKGWLTEARLGSRRDRFARRDTTLWSLAAEHGLSDAVELVAEFEGDDRSRPWLGAALRWAVWPEHAQLKLSYAARNTAAGERKLGLTLAFEF